jgi:hypothetical protein
VFFCEKETPTSELRQAMTKQLDKWLIECVRKLYDGKLMAVLSGGDVVAQELKYHYFNRIITTCYYPQYIGEEL